jgi:hypothetical protein
LVEVPLDSQTFETSQTIRELRVCAPQVLIETVDLFSA